MQTAIVSVQRTEDIGDADGKRALTFRSIYYILRNLEVTMHVNTAFACLSCAAVVTSLLSGCMAIQPLVTQPTLDVTEAPFKASTDLSEAPFRASSELTNGTSQAVTDLTEPTKEFTSSTSPRSWFAGDGTLKAEHKVMAFTVLNYDNLKQDIARGQGEYLASLASLVDVPDEGQADFFAFAQSLYPTVYGEGVKPVDSVNRLIFELPKKPQRLAGYSQ